MESSLQLEPTTLVTDLADDVHPGVTLLTTLYNEKDLLLFRPMETWTEGDRKRSRVDYSHVRYRHANRDGLQRFISHFDFESQKDSPINSLASVRASLTKAALISLGRSERFAACGPTSTTAMLR
jgi:hypothetical protein